MNNSIEIKNENNNNKSNISQMDINILSKIVFDSVNQAMNNKHDEIIETIEDKINSLIPELIKINENNRDMCQNNFNQYMEQHSNMQKRIKKLEDENRELKELLKDTYGNSIINNKNLESKDSNNIDKLGTYNHKEWLL